MNNKMLLVLFLNVLALFSLNAESIKNVSTLNPTTVELELSNQQRITLDFYGTNIVRIFQDPKGGILRDPVASPPAQILVDSPRRNPGRITHEDLGDRIRIQTTSVTIELDKQSSVFTFYNRKTGKKVLESVSAVEFTPKKVSWQLKTVADEYFYGGGVQNGRFSHKGKVIAIENQNSWTDGGVASPNPFYWSTRGYGIMFYTFKKGGYDFGSKDMEVVQLTHETDYFDVFVMVNDGAVGLLNDFYQLTGKPQLMPKFGFYQGHLNAYNRDYWKKDSTGILFEDGNRYRESQKDNGGIKESLNGELPDNYQFSARAVIDRYKSHDMPLGWLLPNDGYGAGYGQTETLDGNIANLKLLAGYAHRNGVEIGLWTQSDLHPRDSISALLQRDIVKEVRDAGVRVLKTDVAWVGAGYSFGLNGVADVGHIMPYYGNDARPFIISLDGWAGTQRYAGIWSGDQTGGQWEYIRFHIPTYIGSGLSGNPNISSDMDGIFGGKNEAVNIRDFQWKTFTPTQLNMDGWGSNPKYPHILGEPAASINRHYLKLKASLIPYAYSVAHESVDGMPMVRAMFLHYPNSFTLGKRTQYQFLFGPDYLVAPVYQTTKADVKGNDIRHGIYLPEGDWFDYFSGEKYAGNRVLNYFDAPIWKLPVFVRAGAIIPMTHPHNNVSEIDPALRMYELYPSGKNTFVEVDDDGRTQAYQHGELVRTTIEAELDTKNNYRLTIHSSNGNFAGFTTRKRTELKVNVSERPKVVEAWQGGKKIKMKEVGSEEAFRSATNVWYYNVAPELNQFATRGSEFAKQSIVKNPQIWVKTAEADIARESLVVRVKGLVLQPANTFLTTDGALVAPRNAQVADSNRTAYTLAPAWDVVMNADYYELLFEGMLYSTIRGTTLLFDDLKPETEYEFQLRAVNSSGVSEWTRITASTMANPLEFAIQGIQATTSCKNQGGSGVANLFDFDEGNMWHTEWSNSNAVPFELIMDLKTINQLDKLSYLPRSEGMNGLVYRGSVSYSNDKMNWTEAGEFQWERDHNAKDFNFAGKPTARYIRVKVDKAVGGFGSGREMYVFKVPGTESYLPGDINNDKLVDQNDLVSYMNYTGLRKGDADFEYISRGDLNSNGLIDAYDISVVATQLEGGIDRQFRDTLQGEVYLKPDKQTYKSGDEVRIVVAGKNFKAVNAFSFAMAYNQQDYEYVGIEAKSVSGMENLTYDRMHTNGNKSLYPTFVNIGDRSGLNGSTELFVIRLKARRTVVFELKATDRILVDKELNLILK
jgi:hypothetical protein